MTFAIDPQCALFDSCSLQSSIRKSVSLRALSALMFKIVKPAGAACAGMTCVGAMT